MNISSWTVRARLTLGFGVVCFLMLIIVVLGLFSLTRINDGLSSVVHDQVPKMQATQTILAQTDVIAIALRNMMLNEDAADRKKQAEVIAAAREQSSKQIDALDRLVTLSEGRKTLDELKDTVPNTVQD